MNRKNEYVRKLIRDVRLNVNFPYERDVIWSIEIDIVDLLDKLTGGDEYPNNFSKKQAKEYIVQILEYIVKGAK